MADEKKGVAGQPTQSTGKSPLELARAKRKADAGQNPSLSPRNRFALNMLLQAQRGCKILAASVRAGAVLEAEVLQAASTLSAQAVGQMSDD